MASLVRRDHLKAIKERLNKLLVDEPDLSATVLSIRFGISLGSATLLRANFRKKQRLENAK